MPFAARRRHQFWSADIRYLDDHGLGGRAYVISVLDNHSRAILSSTPPRTQDLASYLSVLYAAVERYGSPEALITDGDSTFRVNQARAVYEALGVVKEEIERGRPWQSYVETTFNIQRRMADWHFARAETWPGLVAAHDAWVEDYNAQAHWAHRERKDGRRSPREVLGWLTGVRYRPEDLERALSSARFSRVLDFFGLRALPGLEALRRGGTGEKGGRRLVAAGQPHRRVRGRDLLPLRRGAGGRDRGAAIRRQTEALRELPHPPAAQALRPRGGRMDQSAQAERVRPSPAQETGGAAGRPVPVPGRDGRVRWEDGAERARCTAPPKELGSPANPTAHLRREVSGEVWSG